MDQLLHWDQDLFIFLNKFGQAGFDTFWLFFTNQSNWIFLYVFIALLYFYKLGWRKALFTVALLALALGICDQTTNLFKAYFHRLRPSQDPLLDGKIRALLHPHNYSFISGHASNSTLFVWFTITVLRKYTRWIYLLLIWWVLFMYSRIYVGVHYPLDIFFGILWGLILYKITLWIYHKLQARFFTDK